MVGQFPDGAILEGVHDLGGNVWEWTASWYEKDQVNRSSAAGRGTLSGDRPLCVPLRVRPRRLLW